MTTEDIASLLKQKNNKWPRDIHGTKLKDGDIIAEGTVGKVIWNGRAKIMKRPLGIFIVYDKPEVNMRDFPDEKNFRNVIKMREGEVEFIDDEFSDAMTDGKKTAPLHLTVWDGQFYGWEDIEIIGNIHDDFG